MKKKGLVIFFSIQFAATIYVRFTDEKYFGWAPYDQISTYRIEVKIGSSILTPEETSERYNLQNPGRENRNITHIFSQITQFEETYGKFDSAKVRVIFSVNGKTSEEWKYSN